MKRLQLALSIVAVTAFAWLGTHYIVNDRQQNELRQVQLQSTEAKLQTLQIRYDKLNSDLQKAPTPEQLHKVEAEKKQLEDQTRELQQQLSAKRERANQAVATATQTPRVSASGACGDNMYAAYIYGHESGCKTHNPNGSGCDGIGQACPASKLIGPCGYDYACQNAWFTRYANEKYGSWEDAYNFWLANHWW